MPSINEMLRELGVAGVKAMPEPLLVGLCPCCRKGVGVWGF